MIFQHPGWLLVGVFLFFCALIHRGPSSRSAWRKVMSKQVLAMLSNQSAKLSRFNTALMVAAIVAVALSSPSTRNPQADAFQHTDGWFLLADLSRSMTINDVLPSRLAAMRNTLEQLITASGANATSLIIYTADAFMAVPPSFDKQQLHETAALLEYGAIQQDGSNLTRALSLTASSIAESGMTQARLFVLSDTGGIGKNAITAVNYLAKQGHQLDLIVFGNPDSIAGDEQAPNLKNAEQLATAGRGKLLLADSLGVVALDQLSLKSDDHRTQNAAQRAIHWQNQSHWILLLILPLLPGLFREQGAS
jgi:Ca-activated chloride channel family protein